MKVIAAFSKYAKVQEFLTARSRSNGENDSYNVDIWKQL